MSLYVHTEWGSWAAGSRAYHNHIRAAAVVPTLKPRAPPPTSPKIIGSAISSCGFFGQIPASPPPDQVHRVPTGSGQARRIFAAESSPRPNLLAPWTCSVWQKNDPRPRIRPSRVVLHSNIPPPHKPP